jgi:predicted nucleic acid-binding protein
VRTLLGSGERLVASAVTYAEVLTGAMLGHHDQGAVRGFFTDLVSELLPVELETAERAAELRSEHAVRMPDALILAPAALHPAVDCLVGGDRRVAKIKWLGLRYELLLG